MNSNMQNHGSSESPNRYDYIIVGGGSAGRMTLKSADPEAAPNIDLNVFDHPDDARTLVRGIRLARKILAAPAFDAYRGAEITPGEDAHSDE